MDLLYLLYSLLRRKWVILACTLTGIAAAYVFFMFRPKEYVSLAQYSTGFTMEQKVSIKQEESFNIYEIDIRFSNVNVAFASDKVMGMVAYKLLLHDLEDRNPFRVLSDEKKKKNAFVAANISKVKEILRDKIERLELLNSYDRDEKMVMDLIDLYGYDQNSLLKALNQQRLDRTDFINIFANSESPHLSAFMANTAGSELIRFFNEIYGYRSRSASGKLDSLSVAKKNLVDSLSEKLRVFKARMGPMTSGEASTAAMGVVSELYSKYQEESRALNKLEAELRATEQELNDLKNAESAGTSTNNTSGPNNNPEIIRLKQENLDLEKSKTGKTDEEKRKIQDKIDENVNRILQLSPAKGTDRGKNLEKINDRRNDLVSKKIGLEQQIIATRANVKQFLEDKNRYEKMIKEGGGDDVVVREMERDLDIATKEYQTLRNSMQSSLDLDVNPENNFKQTQVAMPSDRPSPTRKMIVSGLAGFLMLFFSCFVILLLEFLDNSYKTPTMFQRATKLKLLTSINKLNLRHKELKDYLDPQSEGKTDPDQLTFLENLRKLRYELEASGKKVILVTSTRPQEGKSLLIESLATGFSMARKKVLIIDANFSNNTLTERFNAKTALEQFSVNGQPNALDKVLSTADATSIPKTEIIGCSEGNYSPAEILPRNNLLASIDKVSEHYDIIFIEAAALNTHSDAMELEKYADGIIAVFSAASSSAQNDKESVEFLKGTGDKFLGAVFNNVQKENVDL